MPTSDPSAVPGAGGAASARRLGPRLLPRFGDAKSVKNRIHFDLRPAEGRRDDELVRLLSLGANQVRDLRKPDGGGWVLLADPEGNEFCILRSEDELAG